MYQQEINKKWQQIHEFRSLLKRTDYADHRQHDEAGKVMSKEIKDARINAREQINTLEMEIELLELEMQEQAQLGDDLK